MGLFDSSWLESYREASYKKVKFFVESSRRVGGKSIVNHEFPERNKSYAEDMGKFGVGFPVTAYVLGDDYMDQRDDLIKALESNGSGILVHPYYGRMNAVAGTNEVIEESKKGRRAVISIQFFDANDYQYPSELIDASAELLASTTSLFESIKNAMATVEFIAGLPGEAVDAARAAVGAAADAFEFVTSPIAMIAEKAAELSYSIRQIKADTDELLNAPDQLADRLLESFQLVTEAVEGPEDRVTLLEGLTTFGNDWEELALNTPTRERMKENDDAIREFMQIAAITTISEQLLNIDFKSITDAKQARDNVVEYINEKLEDDELILSDDVFIALSDLSANLVAAIPDPSISLPDIVEVIPVETVPSLVFTYDLFQDLTKEQDIIDRNNIEHPGFIPGDEPLEIII
jgi:prophage DNA circulation protein